MISNNKEKVGNQYSRQSLHWDFTYCFSIVIILRRNFGPFSAAVEKASENGKNEHNWLADSSMNRKKLKQCIEVSQDDFFGSKIWK